MIAKIETLRRFEVFAGFSDEELTEVAALCQEESYKEGDAILVEGETAEKLFLILEGKVSLEKLVQLGRSGSARRATVDIVGFDRIVGWSSVIAPYIYTSTGVCLEPLYALVLNGQEIRQFVASHPASGVVFLDAIASTISSRLHNATAMLTYLLSVVSHELKSPLAAIENYLQVMLGSFVGASTSRQQHMLKRCILRVTDLRGLINDTLDLARMRPEEIQADFEQLNPSEPSAQAVEDVQLAASEKGVEIRIQVPSRFQPIVAARRRLRQVFSNLLANAVKFSPTGGVVTLHAWDEPERLVVEVMDEGVGIPADEQPFVFEDFFRGRNTEAVAGSGLGLSIARKIVEAHEGEIWVESPYAEGKPGAKFTVVIPRDLTTPDMRRRDCVMRQETAPSVSHREEV